MPREVGSGCRKQWVPTSPNQRVTKRKTVLAVHVEKVDGSASFGSQPKDSSLENSEVMAPYVPAWVVEGGYQTSVRIDRSDIRALLQIAPDAAKAQVFDIVRTMVLTPNDVIDLVR